MAFLKEVDNYYCDETGLYQSIFNEKKDKYEWHWISSPIYLSKVIRVLESEELIWEISFLCNDGWFTDSIHRSKLTQNDFSMLQRKGADVTLWKHKVVIDYLVKSERHTPISYQYNYLGWGTYKKKLLFKHASLSLGDKTNAEYKGMFNIQPKGSLFVWEQTIEKYIKGHTPLELALCLGFSATLVGYINQILGIPQDSLLFHLSGNSTTGKSTAAMVAVSGYGDPKEGPNSLIQSFDGTDNALVSLITKNYGVPITFDETTMTSMKPDKLTSFLYKWAKNVEKARQNRNAEVRERAAWGTTIITTGESSIIGQTNQNEGIRARVFEFEGIQWTKDKEQATKLNHIFSANYGHGVKLFIENLLKYSKGHFQVAWEYEIKTMENHLPNSKFVNRISKKFALVIMTTKLLNETFDFNLDVEGVRQMLIQQEMASLEERLIGPKALEYIREWVLKHQKHFYIKGQGINESQLIYGRIDINKGNTTTVFVLANEFKKMVSLAGFSDTKVVLRELDKLGVLEKEKDSQQNKYHIRRVIKGYEGTKNGVMTYGIKFDGMFIPTTLTSEEISRLPRKRATAKDLVEIEDELFC
ncbi:DUF927 domain-containing protein [Lysinibacillus fusiformis]|uniref:DUF927 domain-containing protein n=1 Tax=Lysinibacillus fusiformis TaxID=28031 RepID=A0A1E4QZU3_9BACI|nr:DUF927 domain-containing protein [Lysinibacillus fusiformis]ODV53740.1 hypothetical protein BG258_20380 [Lysinibacillus fusiformis]